MIRPRTVLGVYHTAARAWLTAAALSLVLPSADRLGVWLPLHLTLAGAVAIAISGSMQNFASALTATPAPPSALTWMQFAAMTIGAGLVAVGYPSGHPGWVAIGGASFVTGVLLLGAVVARAYLRALHRRHLFPMAMYGSAVVCALVGGTFGALIGSRAIQDPATWAALRHAHMTLNVLGFASLTVAGTLVTFLPTVLRIRMPSWFGFETGVLLVGGVALIAAGLALRLASVAAAGGFAYAAGVAGLAWMVARAVRMPRRWPAPLAAKHLVCAFGWYAAGSIALAVALAGGSGGFDAFRDDYLVMLVGGWIVQTLLGAWLYLLPMSRPGHPDDRRRSMAAIEAGGSFQVVALNTGLLLMALRAAGWVPGPVGSVGMWLALGAGALALGKAWTFPLLSRWGPRSKRGAAVWGG